jgi:(p)ppGpp synthase/HD superfamily hydrolase
MMAGSAQSLVEPLLAQLTGRFSQEELERVRHAYAVAARWHAGQWRKSRDPYIVHPVAVAEVAAEVGMDCTMVCAALLHDVLEDTACDREQGNAGTAVATLITLPPVLAAAVKWLRDWLG